MVAAGIATQRFSALRKSQWHSARLRSRCARGREWRRIALRKLRHDERASTATTNDIAVGDELAQCPIDSVARDAEVLGERATRWQPGVRRQRAARDRGTQAIADAHVRRLILARFEAGHVDGEDGARVLGHRLLW